MRKETVNLTHASAQEGNQDTPYSTGSQSTDSHAPAFEQKATGVLGTLKNKLRQIWDGLWQKPAQVNVYFQPESQSVNKTRQVDTYDRPSGFISGPCPENLANQVVYPGVKLGLDQLTGLLRFNLQLIDDNTQQNIQESDVFFLGFGYEWLPKHARRLQDLMEIGIQHSWLNENGSPAIHNLEDHKGFKPLFFKRKLLVGHTLILGTTGSGKTRLFDLLISQAIKRGDAVIVLDPKGDRDLQQGMLKAMRFAGREPINELYCLDVGREVGPRFETSKGRHYAELSLGQPTNWLESQKEQDEYSPLDHLMEGKEVAHDRAMLGSPLDQDSVEMNPDAYFSDFTNMGINPISAFDSSTEISERICAMMPSEGNAASFKAYAQMAVSATIDCLLLTEQKITLENIRSFMGNHRSFLDSLRCFFALTVRKLDLPQVSTYFNRIHGVTIPQLQTFAATVPLLIGDYANKSVTRKKELNLLQKLVESGELNASNSSERLLQDAEQFNDMPDVETDDESKAKSKRGSRSKTAGGVHPAQLDDLLSFYNWMVENKYMPKMNEIDGILSISTLPADYFRKVTSGVMPFLGALTSGNYSDLLSTPDHKLPSLLELIEDRKVVYVALQCMRNASTGQALGKLLMSDLAFVASEVTLRTHDKFPNVSIFIDEASELSNEALVQLLNKSRSSHFSVTLATQSEADLVKRTGSSAAAKEVVANCNNVISLRVNDADTASLVSSALPDTVIGMRSSSIMTSDNNKFLGDSYMTSRSLQQRMGSLFPASCLKLLPNLEFIANMGVNGVYKGFLPILDYSNSEVFGAHSTKHQASATRQDGGKSGNTSDLAQESEQPTQDTLNAQAQDNLDTEEFYRKGGIDPEFDSVAKMIDLGYRVYAEEDLLAEKESEELDSFLEKRPDQHYHNYFVQG